jgi:hypothetical protein
MRQSRWCTGLFVAFPSIPSPLAHRTHDRLPAGIDGDVLDPDHLRLALAPVPVQGFEQRRVGADEPTRLAQRCLPALESLLGKVGAAEAFQRGVVHHDHLRCQHALKRVSGCNVPKRTCGSSLTYLPVPLVAGPHHPQRVPGLVEELQVEAAGPASGDGSPQRPLLGHGVEIGHRRRGGLLAAFGAHRWLFRILGGLGKP